MIEMMFHIGQSLAKVSKEMLYELTGALRFASGQL
jgi:hypothetical protein